MAGLDKPRVVAVCGPTASGKTDLALAISHAFDGEMVGADSMQIYEGLVVGTAALVPGDAEGIPQHLVGFLPPTRPFSVADYVSAASGAIEDITQRGNLPVVCGGTGLYVSSLFNGLDFAPTPGDEALRAALEDEWDAVGGEVMLQQLAKKDAAHAARLHARDRKRVLRSLELATLTGQTAAEREAASRPGEKPYRTLCLCLDFRERAVLYNRIDQRVDAMLASGLLEEARLVYENRDTYKTAAQAIGYKEFFGYFTGELPLEECVAALKTATRRYAKRQLTWFRHMEGTVPLCVDDGDFTQTAMDLVRTFLQ